MKRRGILVTVAGVTLMAGTAMAVGPDAKANAPLYKSFLVRAMEQCDPPVTLVGGVQACPGANVDSDDTNFNKGKVIIKKDGKVITSMNSSSNATSVKALAGKALKTQIVVRITQHIASPATWVDQSLVCPLVTVPASGNYAQSTTLTACGLSASLANTAYIKEVISASVVNNATGLAVGVPGVRKKP